MTSAECEAERLIVRYGESAGPAAWTIGLIHGRAGHKEGRRFYDWVGWAITSHGLPKMLPKPEARRDAAPS